MCVYIYIYILYRERYTYIYTYTYDTYISLSTYIYIYMLYEWLLRLLARRSSEHIVVCGLAPASLMIMIIIILLTTISVFDITNTSNSNSNSSNNSNARNLCFPDAFRKTLAIDLDNVDASAIRGAVSAHSTRRIVFTAPPGEFSRRGTREGR